VLLVVALRAGVPEGPAPQAALVPGAAAQSAAAASPAEPIRRITYNWDVRPILSDTCFRCHGPDEKARQAGLRLDTPEGAYAALRRPGTFAIVPGKPDESQLIARVAHPNVALRMPPRVTNKTLTAEQIETLRQWIAQGAEYQPHWAFVTPRQAAPPAVPAGHGVISDIDRFIVGRLALDGFSPSPEADKETLINRVSLTLTGLPPTLAEVDAFVRDTSPQAYEKLVDRLLASPAYGEQMAHMWLDVARYADSDGFLDDLHDRLLWPYRDWVIGALNRNMPFDQFTTWQLAGDLLPNATRDQRLATAFLRLGRRTNENGAIDEEYRVEYAIDRAVTIGTGFLALTVGCARCHDHKYDPVPTKDFYSLTGFFNSIDEPGFYAPGRSGVTPGPTLPWPDDVTAAEIARAQSALGAAEAAYDRTRAQAAREAAAPALSIAGHAAEIHQLIERSLARNLVGHYPFEETGPVADADLPAALPQARPSPPPLAPETLEDRCASNNGPLVSDVECQRRFREAAQKAAAGDRAAPRVLPGGYVREDLTASPSADGQAPPAVLMLANLREGVKGRAFHFADNEMGVLGRGVGYFERTQPFSLDVWVKAAQTYEDSVILHHRETENAGNAGYQLRIVGGRLQWDMMHARAGNGITLRARRPFPLDEWVQVTLTYDGSSRAAGTRLYVNGAPLDADVVRDSLTRTIVPNGNANQGDQAVGLAFGKRLRAQTLKDGAIDEVRVFRAELTGAEVRHLHRQIRPAGSGVAGGPDATRQEIVDLLVAGDPRVADALATLVKARDIENALVSVVPQVMIMADLPAPRQAYVLVRGNYEDHGEPVAPRGLDTILRWKPSWPENRLGLAQWLFDAQNPLTARVFVNRVWQMHFGRGLVETAEDFGSQGAAPTHPELLDVLAVRFRESGWDVKALHRAIVLSATFRQSSDVSEALLKADPRNLLLGRYSRLRMPAEMVRDHALAASGLLVRRIGGPSVYPYQPPNMWDGFNVYTYPEPGKVPAESHHRRTLYSFIKRNAPHPSMAAFDLPERGGPTARRATSNSPLQALVLMDDPQYVEAYRVLAAGVLRRENVLDVQLRTVFRLAARRTPRTEELAALRDYYDAEVRRYAADPSAAAALVRMGVMPVDESLDATRLAALTNVTAAVMNTPDAYSLR
jgi:hypothetical protein